MQEYYGLLVQAIERDRKSEERVKSDAFASYMVGEHAKVPKNRFFEKEFRIDTLAKINPIGANKTFGTERCRLCKAEKHFILKYIYGGIRNLFGKKPILMNKRNEIHGCCRHHPRFHNFVKSGADELVQFCTPISKKASHAGAVSERESSESSSGTVDTLQTNGSFDDTDEEAGPIENSMETFQLEV